MWFTILFEYTKYLQYIFISWSMYLLFFLFGMYIVYPEVRSRIDFTIRSTFFFRCMQRALYIYVLFSVCIAYLYIVIYLYGRLFEKAVFELCIGFGIVIGFKKVDGFLRMRWMHLYQQLGHVILGVIVILLCLGY